MCTLTFIRNSQGIRLVHSRDEQRTRSEGLPPTPWVCGDHLMLSPRDPDAGGTWLAARDDGVILAVMNRNPEPPPALDRTKLESRGLLIETIAHLPPHELPDALRSIHAARYAPFRAFAAIPGSGKSPQDTPPHDTPPIVWAAEWDASDPSPDARPIVTRHGLPVCWVSSGLGDSVVADRLPLFNEIVAPTPTPQAQDDYHRHAWPDRGAASVLMSRPDARTVSITTAETLPPHARAHPDIPAARVTYLPLTPGPTPADPMTPGEAHFETIEPRNLAPQG